jgi:membrane protease YdiL (CAAX protease family)
MLHHLAPQPKSRIDDLTILPYACRFLRQPEQMQTVPAQAAVQASPSPLKLAVVFAILFIAYQAGEGIAIRVLHSDAVLVALRLMFLPIAWLCGRALGFRGLDAWYMGLSPGWAKLLVACFVLAVLSKTGALAIGETLGVYEVASAEAIAWQSVLMTLLGVLPFTFFPSVAEDIVTRGFLMRALPGLSRHWIFIAASAALFVLNHIYRLSDSPLEWFRLFCFGLAYAAALFYSRSLWAAIGLHWGWNFAGEFADRVASIEAQVPPQGLLLSAAAHLLMLAVVVLASRSLAPAPGVKLQN